MQQVRLRRRGQRPRPGRSAGRTGIADGPRSILRRAAQSAVLDLSFPHAVTEPPAAFGAGQRR